MPRTRVSFVPMIDLTTGADHIVVRAEIDAPRERVWRALTEEEGVAEWWGDYVSLDARPGGRLTERWTDAGGREVLTFGEVVRMSAPRTLELRWADEDWDEPTRVLLLLDEATSGTTRLTLEHSGWEVFPPSTREELIRTHALGWSHHVTNLAAYSAGASR
jgi:uncharacterized protein YndB with AHSA1/START domain